MPVPAGDSWAPSVQQVADYLPHRTLARSETSLTEGQDVYELTFDATTRPTGDTVARLITDGVTWVTSRVSPLNTGSEGAARVVATLYAAAAVERGWPADDSSLQRANDLERRMDTLLAGLLVSNEAANEKDNVPDAAGHPLPLWSFPAADRRYDLGLYW